MIIIKAWRHILAYISLLFYKLIFAGKLYVGKGTTWRKGFSLMIAPNGKVSIGDNCFFNNNCSINSLEDVSIGDGCIFGEGVKIYDHNHRFADFSVPLKREGYSTSNVTIGNRCWIGSNVLILKGANIGDNCVIGAGCIISGNIESGTLVKPSTNNVVEKIKPVNKSLDD